MHVTIYVCMYIMHTHMCALAETRLSAQLITCMYVRSIMCMSIHTDTIMYMHIYIYNHIHTHTYIRLHTYKQFALIALLAVTFTSSLIYIYTHPYVPHTYTGSSLWLLFLRPHLKHYWYISLRYLWYTHMHTHVLAHTRIHTNTHTHKQSSLNALSVDAFRQLCT